MKDVNEIYFWIIKVINSIKTDHHYETAYNLYQVFITGFPKEKELHNMLDISLQKAYYNLI